MKERIWEIDYFRGIAIFLMVIFHLIVDLKDFHGFQVEYLSGFWYYEGKFSAVLFIFLAGVSSTLNQRATKHGVKVLAAGLLVTGVTFLFNSETYVRFGILHFLGVSILLAPILRKLSSVKLTVLAALLLVLPVWTDALTVGSGLLLPIGITPASFTSMDYYPLVPWLGVFITGMVLGQRWYAHKKSLLPQRRRLSKIAWLGRHSLILYLVHQPILLAMLYVIV
jgi:uncharacterized membrane protein